MFASSKVSVSPITWRGVARNFDGRLICLQFTLATNFLWAFVGLIMVNVVRSGQE